MKQFKIGKWICLAVAVLLSDIMMERTAKPCVFGRRSLRSWYSCLHWFVLGISQERESYSLK